jgi:hypothetical protein
MKLRKILIIASLASFGAFTQQAFAEPENCAARMNYCIRNGEKMAAFGACSKAEHACEQRNRDRGYTSRDDVKGRGPKKDVKGGKAASDGVTGDGKTTTTAKPPTVNDHRKPEAPNSPPAAAAGTGSTTPVTNPNEVRDHRRKPN